MIIAILKWYLCIFAFFFYVDNFHLFLLRTVHVNKFPRNNITIEKFWWRSWCHECQWQSQGKCSIIQGCDIRYRVASTFHSSFLVLAQLYWSFQLRNRFWRAIIKLYSYNRTKYLMCKRSNSCMNTSLVSLQKLFWLYINIFEKMLWIFSIKSIFNKNLYINIKIQ